MDIEKYVEERCHYSILEVAETLHEISKGTADGTDIETIIALRNWLYNRVTKLWVTPDNNDKLKHAVCDKETSYDVAVKLISLIAVDETNTYLRKLEWKEINGE